MSQYDVYANPSPRSRDRVPYVVDVQSDLLSALPTRLVMPLGRAGSELSHPPRRLFPRFDIQGEVVALMPQLALGLDAKLLRRPVASLADRAGDIRDALDAVVSGI